MPDNNENNNNNIMNDMPKLNNDINPNLDNNNINENPFAEQANKPINNETIQEKQKIEIPQKYYDNLAREAETKKIQEDIMQQNKEQKKELQMNINNLLSLSLLNGALLFLFIYLSYNGKPILFLAIPAYMILLTIIEAITKKEESIYPISLMLGSILVAVITFILSMIKTEQMDFWTYFAAISATLGLIGLITSNIITKILTTPKDMKAMQIIGSILYFAALVGIPYYLYNYHHEEVFKILFNEQVEVKAETEEEFIFKTLKTRYNQDFICKQESIKNFIDQDSVKVTERKCNDQYGKEIIVQTKTYNETEHKYIVTDNYLDVIFLDNIKTEISNQIFNLIEAKKIDILLYPGKECKFIGDCAENDDFYKEYKEIMNNANQFKLSTELNFTKDLLLNTKDFVNSKNFKYIINISGNFPNPAYYNEAINKVLDLLNQQGYKNNYGYVISIYNLSESNSGSTSKLVYRVQGTTNSEKAFIDPQEVNVHGNH